MPEIQCTVCRARPAEHRFDLVLLLGAELEITIYACASCFPPRRRSRGRQLTRRGFQWNAGCWIRRDAATGEQAETLDRIEAAQPWNAPRLKRP